MVEVFKSMKKKFLIDHPYDFSSLIKVRKIEEVKIEFVQKFKHIRVTKCKSKYYYGPRHFRYSWEILFHP